MNQEINYVNLLSILNLNTSSYYFSKKPFNFNHIIIPINQIKNFEAKKKIYESLAEYNNLNGGRFTEFLSKFYAGEIK